MRIQTPLPEAILNLGPEATKARIAEIKELLGKKLAILGHHYQADDVLSFSDFKGDSLGLSRVAAECEGVEYIVFCGVHFMAESAAILSPPGRKVMIPNASAGCPMADMADADNLETAMQELLAMTDEKVVPVTYVNSTAAAKAVTGRYDGTCCTSGNAFEVFSSLLDPSQGGAKKLLMSPDQHLGRNTAFAMGYDNDDCAVYDPSLPNGGLTPEQVERATFLLWKGHCYVHQRFQPKHVAAAREADPDAIIMVHPECDRNVVELCDRAGSTEQIIKALAASEPGSHWVIGTEDHLVARLNDKYPDRTVTCLSPERPTCLQMAQIELPYLLWVLEGIVSGELVNVVSPAPEIVAEAKISLSRMLEARPS
jgi:quinolinate synthase